ncbi:MAG: endonuclease/exonuclease/phosphatase family protein [Flavobacteriales bacterium]|nr:endonuclease/exonuclease/phosphatase family protein [Flavobacteriales bacterium]
MRLHRFLTVGAAWALITLFGCKKEPLAEYPENSSSAQVEVSEIRISTYNIHGGHGPNGEGNFQDNLTGFKSFLQNESILCFQEVEPDCWNQLKSIFSDYPYRYFLPQCSTKFGTNKQGGNAIFSKLPILSYDQQLIQTDPGGDRWERKAQYIRVFVGNDHQYLNIFHYHNTYNWHENNSASEKAGLQKFVSFVASKDLTAGEMNVLLGDFNLSRNQADAIVPVLLFPQASSNWVDHIYTNAPVLNTGFYDTYGNSLSDHQAVWMVICNEDC